MEGKIKFGPKNIRDVKDSDLKQIGFQLEGEETWHSVQGAEEALKVVMPMLRTGNVVSFDDAIGIATNIKILEEAPKKKGDWHDDMNSFEDLLTEAHKQFISTLNIRTEMIEVSFEKKTALFKCMVDVGGRVFEAHGDASEESVTTDTIKPHFIRMAETRAIARALRWATNNAKVAKEETD